MINFKGSDQQAVKWGETVVLCNDGGTLYSGPDASWRRESRAMQQDKPISSPIM